jgi:hypothetical protein
MRCWRGPPRASHNTDTNTRKSGKKEAEAWKKRRYKHAKKGGTSIEKLTVKNKTGCQPKVSCSNGGITKCAMTRSAAMKLHTFH